MDDPDKAFESFFNKLFNIYKKCFPIKKKKIKNNLLNQPWINTILKKCIKKKYYLYNLLKRGRITRRSFNIYKKTLSWVIRKIKAKYYNDKFTSNNGDKKKTWNDINDLLGRKNKGFVTQVVDEQGNINKGPQMVNKFNEYFVSIANNIISNVPDTVESNYFSKIFSNVNSCFLYPTNEVEVLDVMKSLNNKGNSIFDIKPRILLSIKDKLLPVLSYLFNFCVSAGIYPSILKISRVVPL